MDNRISSHLCSCVSCGCSAITALTLWVAVASEIKNSSTGSVSLFNSQIGLEKIQIF